MTLIYSSTDGNSLNIALPISKENPKAEWNKARQASQQLAESFLVFKYLRKIFHDARPLGLQHCEYRALCIEVYHAAPGPPEAIPLMLTI